MSQWLDGGPPAHPRAPHAQVLGTGPAGLTLDKGFLQLQEAPEGEVGQVWAAPDPILPEVLLHPHPVCCLHPPQLLVLLIHHQFLQLHIHLRPRKPESVSQAWGRALGRLAVQGVVGTQQALRAVWRRPGVLEHSGQTLSSEGTGGSCSLGVLSEVGSVGGGMQPTTLALFPNSLARPLPHFRGTGEPLDQKEC